MRPYMWGWLFAGSLAFCGLLALGLLIAFALFYVAPHNQHTPLFAAGFGFTLGFIGLGTMTVLFFDRITRRLDLLQDREGDLLRKVVKESPFFFFSLLYFFMLAAFIGFFLMMLPYIKHACA
jgi:hypothetical protein